MSTTPRTSASLLRAYSSTVNAHFVEITATTDEDTSPIFETMNDRGLSLTPLDMLQGYLLANMKDAAKRNEASTVWRRCCGRSSTSRAATSPAPATATATGW